MKQFLLVTSLLLQIIQSQAQLSDDFTDGNFSDSPGWNGDISDFIINANLELQLNAPIAGSSVLSTAYEIPDSCVWEIYFKMDFAPSAANLLRIYLQSSAENLLSGKAYYVEIGESGSTDAIKFYRQDSQSSKFLLGTGTLGTLASQPAIAKLKITRSKIGAWIIAADYSGGNNFSTEISITDNKYQAGQSYFGVYCLYTETRKDKFYFDDIKCYQPTKDIQAPLFINLGILDQNQIDLLFDENLQESIVEDIANYNLLPNIGSPSKATLDPNKPNILHLEFDEAFVTQTTYTLSVQNITDLSSNVLSPFDVVFNYNVGVAPILNDILITEIFADPTPQIGLPLFEFVEIYNRSKNYLSISGLSFSDGTSTSLLPGFLFPPESYLILCSKADTSAFKNLGPALGLISFPSLNNTGDILSLKNEDGDLINSVNYTDNWYNNSDKKAGGWSLELINPNSKCTGKENWNPSIDPKGGTPGQQNSVFNSLNDIVPPILLSAVKIDDYTLQLSFNESLPEDVILSGSLFSIDQGINILNIQQNIEHYQLTIKIDKPFSYGISYKLQLLAGLTDCSGNQTTEIQSIQIILPSLPQLHDIVINEILFNPRSGGYDFIELYNRSDNTFNISNLIIANTINGVDERSLSASRLLTPGGFIVLTESPDNIKMEYDVKDTSALFKMDLPSFNDDKEK